MVTRRGDRTKQRDANPDAATDTATQHKRAKSDGFPWLLFFGQCMILLVLGGLIWQSMAVYAGIGQAMAEGAIVRYSPPWLVWWEQNTWFVGTAIAWVLHGGLGLLYVAAMLALYCLLQLGECAPILLERSPQTLRRLIYSITSQVNLVISPKDHHTVVRLKEKHNNIPTKWINSIYLAKWIAYGLDLLICLWACPPLKGGWSKFERFAMAPVVSDIDFGNIWKILITLFAVEAALLVWLWLRTGRRVLATNPQANKESHV